MTILSRLKPTKIIIQPRLWSIKDGEITIIGSNSQLVEVKIKSNESDLNEWVKNNKILPNAPLKITNFKPAFKNFDVSCSILANIENIENKIVQHHTPLVAVVEKKGSDFFINGKKYSNIENELNNFQKYNLIVAQNKEEFGFSNSIKNHTPILDLSKYSEEIGKYNSLNAFWKQRGNEVMKILETQVLHM